MKTTSSPASRLIRVAALTALLALPAVATLAADRAAELLARQGAVAVKNAGPYVEVGTFQVQVVAKLGQPSARLADGTWLFAHYEVEESNARGTLVVRFARGRVAELALVTPAIATAMTAPKKTSDKTLVAHER